MATATTPRYTGDRRYVFGETCTWHCFIACASNLKDGTPVCPFCIGPLQEVESEAYWWAMVAENEPAKPGLEAMMRWSQGKCFPDVETMENAYRQAMEGTE